MLLPALSGTQVHVDSVPQRCFGGACRIHRWSRSTRWWQQAGCSVSHARWECALAKAHLVYNDRGADAPCPLP